MGYTVLQKNRSRYEFIKGVYRGSGNPRYTVKVEHLGIGGSSVSYRDVSKEAGNKLYLELIEKGFKQFRNAHEVSWYATIENNTPYDEEWTTEGKFLVPIKSESIA